MYDMTYSSGGLESLLVVIGAYVLIILAVALAFGIMQLVGTWKMFKKAGVPGWYSIIPFYSTYTMCRLYWNTNVFWGMMGCMVLYAACIYIGENAMMFLFIPAVALLVLEIMLYWYMGKAYGKSGGFFAGLLLLTPIFMLILGLDDSQYVGNPTQPRQAY